jgi:hypothetical protein
MFISRTLTDSRFDSKVGHEILMIFYRKEEWEWTDLKEIELAEETLVRTAEDMPPGPDVLFSHSWIDKISNVNDKGIRIGPASAANAVPQFEDFYTLDFPGYVVSATEPFVREMYYKGLFGLPKENKSDKIHPGAPIFLFDPQAQLFHGIFKTDRPITENLDPKAFMNWQQGGSMLPFQFPFVSVFTNDFQRPEQPPIHIMDPQFKSIYPEGPVVGSIGLKETKLLANLFALRAGIAPVLKAAAPISAIGPGGVPVTGMYKPPFKNIDTVPIDIQGNIYDIKKKLLGNNASVVLALANEVTGGNSRSMRIRMRGINSGYLEGPSQIELPEPLHFNISAESEELLARGIIAVKNLIATVKLEF